jgi:O-antigen/teichoic acid export membrane protein
MIALGSIVVVYLMMKYYIDERYAGAWHYYYMIATTYGLWSIVMLFYGFLNYFKMKRLMLYFGLGGLLILAPLQYLTTQYMGILGLMGCQLLYFLGWLVLILVILNQKFKKIYNPS